MITIRRMRAEDVTEVFSIEKLAHITPWNESILRDCVSVGYLCFVLEDGNSLYGFMIARGTQKQCHLLNLCVSPKHQGKGFGESLLLFLMDFVKEGCSNMQLEVRPSNKAAIHLYQKYDFKEINRKKEYYADTDGTFEDAIMLCCTW